MINKTKPDRGVGYRLLRTIRRSFIVLILTVALVSSFVLSKPEKSYACSEFCICVPIAHAAIRSTVRTMHQATRQYITLQFELHRQTFVIPVFFYDHVLEAMRRMTDQLISTGMMEMAMVGSFFDATQQLQTQRLLQRLTAEAHKDYHPSVDMCAIGTVSRGLGATSQQAKTTTYLLMERSIDRQLANANTAGGEGQGFDKKYRVDRFRRLHCNKMDSNASLQPICMNTATAETVNRDVDFTRSILNPLTLENVDFTIPAATPEEENVLAMANNLYAHDIFYLVPMDYLLNEGNQASLLDMRSIVAKRSVAEYSFANLVGMKAAGSAAAATNGEYAQVVLRDLGIPEGETEALLGENPSYHALMEVLTKKIYQDPEFYTNLYDKPANVARKGAAIRAISLMQDMDRFKSQLRNEMMLSVLLELEISDAQTDVQNRLNALTTEGEKKP